MRYDAAFVDFSLKVDKYFFIFKNIFHGSKINFMPIGSCILFPHFDFFSKFDFIAQIYVIHIFYGDVIDSNVMITLILILGLVQIHV